MKAYINYCSKTAIKYMIPYLLLLIFGALTEVMGQSKQTVALISIDTRNLDIDNVTMSNIVRLELEKINRYEVLDKYDVSDALERNNIDPNSTYGKNAVLEAGKLLGANKMITGSAELFADKIIIILRLVDVQSGKVEETSVMEYLNVQPEIQTMAMISLNELLNIDNDEHLVDLLINYNLPITTMRTTVNLNGPRMGAVYTMGDNGDRLMAAKNDGGYNMFPVTSMFGYQYEQQYLSSGDFQALVELIAAINGLESGYFIPSITFMNGFRFNDTGFEFGLGPIFRITKQADGYYENGRWIPNSTVEVRPENVRVVSRIDSRGDLKASMGLIVAVGKTFRSGYLNVPVNVYCSPRKDGTIVGLTFGFNTTKKPSFN